MINLDDTAAFWRLRSKSHHGHDGSFRSIVQMEMKKFLKVTLAPVVGMGKKGGAISQMPRVMSQGACCAQEIWLENPVYPIREKITREEGLHHRTMVMHIYPRN